ncbi:hypothetical protein GCM10027287_27410 [Bordetella muralis]
MRTVLAGVAACETVVVAIVAPVRPIATRAAAHNLFIFNSIAIPMIDDLLNRAGDARDAAHAGVCFFVLRVALLVMRRSGR